MSMQQAATGAKTPFARTPKVENRTTVPRLYIVAPLAFALSAAISAGLHLQHGFGLDTAFALLTAGLLLYAMLVFVGPRAAFTDLLRPVGETTKGSETAERRPVTQDQAA
jgi:hypothetical protein